MQLLQGLETRKVSPIGTSFSGLFGASMCRSVMICIKRQTINRLMHMGSYGLLDIATCRSVMICIKGRSSTDSCTRV